MKRSALITSSYLVLLLAALLPLQQIVAPSPVLPTPQQLAARSAPAPAPQAPEAKSETRALWVVRHTMVSPEAIRALVRRASENGFTDLVVQVRGRGDAYYLSRLEPRAEELAGQPANFDPLALVIDEAHQAGIKVHAWINLYVVANIEPLPKVRDHLIFKHPEWIMVPRALAAELYDLDPRSREYLARIVEHTRGNRKDLEGIFVTPSHDEVKENLFRIWMDVAAKYAVDGLHFDYVRYPNPQFDYSRNSLDRFRAEMEPNLAEDDRAMVAGRYRDNPLAYATTFPERYAQFQRRQVTELVERIYKGVKSVKPGALISAAVFANDDDAARSRYQDWKTWMRQGWLDVLCPMAYTPDTNTYRKQIANAMTHAAGRQVWGGIGAYKQTAEGAVEKILVTRELGAQGFVLFSYDSSIKVSSLNPQGDYLEKIRDGLRGETKDQTSSFIR
ncbi:MAG: glycoside hydrolase family 10 protein [Blastocatellia bacterium]